MPLQKQNNIRPSSLYANHILGSCSVYGKLPRLCSAPIIFTTSQVWLHCKYKHKLQLQFNSNNLHASSSMRTSKVYTSEAIHSSRFIQYNFSQHRWLQQESAHQTHAQCTLQPRLCGSNMYNKNHCTLLRTDNMVTMLYMSPTQHMLYKRQTIHDYLQTDGQVIVGSYFITLQRVHTNAILRPTVNAYVIRLIVNTGGFALAMEVYAETRVPNCAIC